MLSEQVQELHRRCCPPEVRDNMLGINLRLSWYARHGFLMVNARRDHVKYPFMMQLHEVGDGQLCLEYRLIPLMVRVRE